MRLDEYASRDATALAELVRANEVTPAELGACALDAAEALAEPLNATVEVFRERAASLGRDAPPGPFGGVPTMVKDLFHGEAGTVCGNGSRLSQQWVVRAESGFTSLIRESGLINLGRTTTSEFGIMGTTETLAAGRTCTPWSRDHIAGGSSGGSAAAVGAGIVPVASASDGGGSIRIPAAACGIVGLKPTRGRITWGPQVGEALHGWAVHFVVTRSVRDTASMLDCLARPSLGDPFVIMAPSRPFVAEMGAPVEPLRVAYCGEPWSGVEADPDVTAALEATARTLADLGHEVTAARPQFAWEPFLQAMTAIWAADVAHTIDRIVPVLDREPGPDTLEGATLAALEYGRGVTALELFDADGVVNRLARVMGSFFEVYDVLLTPTLGRLPAELGTYDPHERIELHDLFDTWSVLEGFLPAFNATGLPAISLPLRMSSSGLPIGMQLAAGFGQESLLLRLSSQLEEALPWAGRRPPIHAAAAASAD